MTNYALTNLRRQFLERYDDLKARLTKRLGSNDLADDAMQDTWLRLAHAETVGAVRQPRSYLFRMALNVAIDRRRVEARRPTADMETELVLDVADDMPTPERTVMARSELEHLKAVVNELPPRRRMVFIAARFGNASRQEIADRMGISLRLVAKELQLALEHCAARCKELED
jgi:RNA polymerase sigma-70 factor, ECF subfamily